MIFFREKVYGVRIFTTVCSASCHVCLTPPKCTKVTEPACIWEEKLRSRESKCHPEKLPEAPGPIDVHTVQVLLGVSITVETHGTKEARQTEQVIAVKMGDEYLGDTTCMKNMLKQERES